MSESQPSFVRRRVFNPHRMTVTARDSAPESTVSRPGARDLPSGLRLAKITISTKKESATFFASSAKRVKFQRPVHGVIT
jgi:hypothetical protein